MPSIGGASVTSEQDADRATGRAGALAGAAAVVAAIGLPVGDGLKATPGADAREGDPVRPSAPAAAADTGQLATGPYSRMEALLERTILQVNVVHLTLRYDTATAARLRRAARGRSFSRALADSVAAAVLDARRVHARLEFRRDIGLERYLSSVHENMARARDAGMLADSAFRRFEGRLPSWYAALEGRGVRDRDVIEYRIRSDTLRVLYRASAGDTLIDRRDVGEQHRRAVLGGFLAPGIDFREDLVRSLLRSDGQGP